MRSRVLSQHAPVLTAFPRSLSLFLPHPIQLLQEKLGFRFRSVRESFTHYDADMDGSIGDAEFRNSRE